MSAPVDSFQIDIRTALDCANQDDGIDIVLSDYPNLDEKSILYTWHTPKEDKGYKLSDWYKRKSTIHDQGRFTRRSEIYELMKRPQCATVIGDFTKSTFSSIREKLQDPQITQPEFRESYKIEGIVERLNPDNEDRNREVLLKPIPSRKFTIEDALHFEHGYSRQHTITFK